MDEQMGRIALFVILVAGAGYFAIDLVARVLGATISPVVEISLAVLLAIVSWTVLIWWIGDRIGQANDTDERNRS
jgi:integral membrane sensor domain MASE1